MNHPGLRSAPRRRLGDRSQRRRSGFTLLELLLVLSILVVVGGIAVVNLSSAGDDANRNATITQLNALEQAIEMYRIRMNSLPETLDNLVEGPSDSAQKAKWGKAILDEVPADAWGKEIVYKLNGNEYELRSGGSDGQMNTEDDLTVTGS
ncbi:type II secretion system protein GspG [Crateriforma conspicua]|uniref:Putative type II secretion system protein G n=1 Tax=Crateriforma conspicua TaxID=2527996 RepID=A0A5C5YAE8_9PLAN|nr:type II secretion system protein GspG [Crateriforma conspicua]TWT70282.1 putative type II secretion system protein G precursor [Crateriforma conspicua]